MNKFIALICAALISIGCNNAANTNAVNKSTVQTATAPNVPTAGNQAIVSSHSENPEKPAAPRNDAPSTGSPMAQPIDVSQMTADIAKAEKEYKKNPKAKDDLAKAYFIRATALTGAAQYRSALGDYRKGLKLDPNDESAKGMHDQIISIFKSINREPPKEGEEPPPLPVQ